MNRNRPTLRAVPVYEVRLVQSRHPLRLAETVIPEADSAARALHALVGLTDREHFAALFLNGNHHVTGAHIVAIGSQHGITSIDARTTFRAAIAARASAIVLGHNHPSGDPSPSPEDLATTAKLMQAGDVLGIAVVDHVIVTHDPRRWYSMTTHGTLPRLPPSA